MATTPPHTPIVSSAPDRITGLHHVGHVVEDPQVALATYRRMGFRVPALSYPALPNPDSGAMEAFGTGNAHIEFARNFVEIVAVGRADMRGEDAKLVPLEVPAEKLALLEENLRTTATRLREALERFQGIHILVFEAENVDAAASRLAATGIPHTGVQRIMRTGGSDHDTRAVLISYVEIETEPGRSPEGRLTLAEPTAREVIVGTNHPNGAVELVEAILCVPDADVDRCQHRYERYVSRAARDLGPSRRIDMDGSAITITPSSDLRTSMLGVEPPPVLPAFIGYTVAVHDLQQTRTYLTEAGIPLRANPAADRLLIAPQHTSGAAVIFTQARHNGALH